MRFVTRVPRIGCGDQVPLMGVGWRPIVGRSGSVRGRHPSGGVGVHDLEAARSVTRLARPLNVLVQNRCRPLIKHCASSSICKGPCILLRARPGTILGARSRCVVDPRAKLRPEALQLRTIFDRASHNGCMANIVDGTLVGDHCTKELGPNV